MKKLVTFCLTVALTFSMTACSSKQPQETSVSEQTGNTISEETKTITVYEDEYVKVTFSGMIEQESVPGTAYAGFTFENLSDQEITVLPVDSSVNGTMVQFLSGVPATMQAGKKFNQSWFFTFQNAGVTELSEITQLEFSLSIVDKNFSELVRTDALTVDVK